MPHFTEIDSLNQYRQQLVEDHHRAQVQTAAIIVGMGTCGQAAGAGEVLQAIHKELAKLAKPDLQVEVRMVGCIGLCVREPLVDVQLPGKPRVTYTNVKPSQVSRIISEHLVGGNVITEWALGYVPEEW
jgi:(2Fe-2S) ferredoxin